MKYFYIFVEKFLITTFKYFNSLNTEDQFHIFYIKFIPFTSTQTNYSVQLGRDVLNLSISSVTFPLEKTGDKILCREFFKQCSQEKLLHQSKASRIGQKKSNSSAFGREGTNSLMRSSGAGVALKLLRQRGQVFLCPHLPNTGCGLSWRERDMRLSSSPQSLNVLVLKGRS